METPAAAPSQPSREIPSDILPQPSSAITFSGSPGESSGDFVQAIQRVGFQQGHARDDQLDNETQDSWKRLRTALLRRYSAASPSSALPPKEPTQAPATRDAPSARSRGTKNKSGLIEVFGDKTVVKRYVPASPDSAPTKNPTPTPGTGDASSAPSLDVTTKSELIEMHGDKITVKLYPAASPDSAPTLMTPIQNPATNDTSSAPSLDLTTKYGSIEVLKDKTAVKQYPGATSGSAPPMKPTQTPATSNTSSAPSRDTTKKTGLIEVLGEKNKTLGYLCLYSESLVGITKTKASAAVVNLPPQLPSEPIQLSLDGILGDKNFRNLGLNLLVSSAKEDSDHIPEKIKIVQEWDDYGDGVSFEYELGVPTPSILCKAYIQHESSKLNLHVHRASDMQEAGRFFEEDRVRFVFRHTD
ncbi:hypothetical protein FS837_002775 [Tulasnella sp. UAMH 9824]|nr:hypothetical protein FS837_002775 [Tulasnella sp. UAMH 9824]